MAPAGINTGDTAWMLVSTALVLMDYNSRSKVAQNTDGFFCYTIASFQNKIAFFGSV